MSVHFTGFGSLHGIVPSYPVQTRDSLSLFFRPAEFTSTKYYNIVEMSDQYGHARAVAMMFQQGSGALFPMVNGGAGWVVHGYPTTGIDDAPQWHHLFISMEPNEVAPGYKQMTFMIDGDVDGAAVWDDVPEGGNIAWEISLGNSPGHWYDYLLERLVGEISAVTYWPQDTLTLAEGQALAQGVSPHVVHPLGVYHRWPLGGLETWKWTFYYNQIRYLDLVGKCNMWANSDGQVIDSTDEPRLFYPRPGPSPFLHSPLIPCRVRERLVLGESIGKQLTLHPRVDESLLLGDRTRGIRPLPVTVSEGLVLGDVAKRVRALNLGRTEGLVLGDTARKRLVLRPRVREGLVLGESIAAARYRRHHSSLRGLYRIFNAPGYRLYRSNAGPPAEGDTPFATNATLPYTPAATFADGTWYLSMSYFNGVLDSGFLPIGPRGETYLRLDVSGGSASGSPPQGPFDWRLELAAGGQVRVLAFYHEEPPSRAGYWTIGYTSDGTDPAEDHVDAWQPIDATGMAVLSYLLPAAANGATVKVRLQTRRNDGDDVTPVWVYSDGSTVKSIVADATGPTTPLSGERWVGRIPE